MKMFVERGFVVGICGDIAVETQQKWAPKTIWSRRGWGTVRKEGSGFAVRDRNKELVGFEKNGKRGLESLVGRVVDVWHRASPLGYNGFYDSETAWLERGESQNTLLAPYPEPSPPDPVVCRLFGMQAEQAACLPS
jgi:hypothetical protein